jgi:hypothetical protein
MSVHTTAEAIQQTATAATYTGSGMAVGFSGLKYFGLTTSEWTLLFAGVGALMAIGGFLVNWYYKHRHLQIAIKANGLSDED